jgi:diguanylate cyclase (GGDEF)-like protein/PAS domain S-box-containing protein
MDSQDRINEELTAEIHTMRDRIDEVVALNSRLHEEIEQLKQNNAILVEYQDRTGLALWAGQVFLWDWNVLTNTVYVSDRWANILGYDWDENTRPLQEWRDLFHHEDIDRLTDAAQSYIEGPNKCYEAECRIKNGQDEWVWVRLSGKMIFKDHNGRTLRSLGLGSPSLQNQALEDSEQRYRALFENNPVGLFKYDAHGNITDLNHYMLQVLGAPSKEELRHLNQLAQSEKEMALIKYELLETVREGKPGTGEIHFVSSWDREVWLQYKANPIYDQHGKVIEVIVACEEISERKQAEERIRYLSFNDPLTGLYNRAFFQEELKRLDTQRQLPMSIIMGDLNSLKLINDAFGHHKGDAVLKAAADVLRASCRHEDIIARLGGDEFVVLLPMTSADVAEEICNRIQNNCRKTEQSSEQVSLALGMATRTDITQDLEDIMREAEDRMYHNKLIESRNIRSSFIMSLERTLREKSHETEEHTARLQQMSSMIGKGMRMSEAELDALNLLAALHDIGKIAIPSTILDKADFLSMEEWDTMKKHPEIGYRIALSTPELVPIAEAILAHHESWNGNGYPLGLKEEKIPLLSRILSVCDAYDVMVNGRPYREPISKQEALNELQRCAGTQFDPHVVKVFVEKMA